MKKKSRTVSTNAQLREAIEVLERKVDSHIIKLGRVCEYVQTITNEHPCRPGVAINPPLTRWQHLKAAIKPS